jgi:predicted HTH domain antitoxin
MSEKVTITIPSALAQELDSTGQELLVEILERGLREIKIERALDRYGRGGMSFGAAAHQAGVSQSELARQAYARGMEPPYSAESLAEEVG